MIARSLTKTSLSFCPIFCPRSLAKATLQGVRCRNTQRRRARTRIGEVFGVSHAGHTDATGLLVADAARFLVAEAVEELSELAGVASEDTVEVWNDSVVLVSAGEMTVPAYPVRNLLEDDIFASVMVRFPVNGQLFHDASECARKPYQRSASSCLPLGPATLHSRLRSKICQPQAWSDPRPL